MSTPKKIEPDLIKECIVQLRYRANIHVEILHGMLYSKLQDRFDYYPPKPVSNEKSAEAIFTQSEIGYFKDKDKGDLRLIILPDRITFSLTNETYPGWDTYFDLVKTVIKGLEELEAVNNFERIGVRFVNVLKENRLSDAFSLNIHIGAIEEEELAKAKLRINYDFYSGDHQILLNLLDNPNSKEEQSVPAVIDIDVIKKFDNEKSYNKIIEEINISHDKEKSFFFKLMKSEFLKGLEPKY